MIWSEVAVCTHVCVLAAVLPKQPVSSMEEYLARERVRAEALRSHHRSTERREQLIQQEVQHSRSQAPLKAKPSTASVSATNQTSAVEIKTATSVPAPAVISRSESNGQVSSKENLNHLKGSPSGDAFVIPVQEHPTGPMPKFSKAPKKGVVKVSSVVCQARLKARGSNLVYQSYDHSHSYLKSNLVIIAFGRLRVTTSGIIPMSAELL